MSHHQPIASLYSFFLLDKPSTPCGESQGTGIQWFSLFFPLSLQLSPHDGSQWLHGLFPSTRLGWDSVSTQRSWCPWFLPGPASTRILKSRCLRLRRGDSQRKVRTAKTVKLEDAAHLPQGALRFPPLQCLVPSRPSSSLLTLPGAFLQGILLTGRYIWPPCSSLPIPPNLLFSMHISCPLKYVITLMFLSSDKDEPVACIRPRVFLSPFHKSGHADSVVWWSACSQAADSVSEKNSHPEPLRPHPRLFLLFHTTRGSVSDTQWK